MAITGIDHVQLAMPRGGEDVAREFYTGVLGLEEIPKPANLAARGGCWFTNIGAGAGMGGSVHIHLGVEEGFAPAKKAHPALLVDDMAKMRETLRAAGVAFAEGKPLANYIRGDIYDPFGNRIELMQRV